MLLPVELILEGTFYIRSPSASSFFTQVAWI